MSEEDRVGGVELLVQRELANGGDMYTEWSERLPKYFKDVTSESLARMRAMEKEQLRKIHPEVDVDSLRPGNAECVEASDEVDGFYKDLGIDPAPGHGYGLPNFKQHQEDLGYKEGADYYIVPQAYSLGGNELEGYVRIYYREGL